VTRGLVVFEDERWRALRPLTDVLPVPSLAFGASTLVERWRQTTRPSWLAVSARPAALAAAGLASDAPRGGELVVAVNAAALPGPWFDAVAAASAPAAYASGDRIVAAAVPADEAARAVEGGGFAAWLAAARLPRTAVDARVIGHAWDLVAWNGEAIAADLAGAPATSDGTVHPQAVVLEPDRVRIGRGARIDPCAVLDAREGPIQLGEGVIVAPHTLVVGPCVVGAGTQLLGGLVARSTIGPECRLAGEIDDSVWQGYANKRHHGFVGHTLVGEWANLGAMTTTSDLKNNYGTIRTWVDGRTVDSGVRKLGAVIGAHAKTGIGSLLPSGGVIGVGANAFGGGQFAPKLVPPFGWWDGNSMVEHRFEAFIETARTAMGRRGRTLDRAQEELLKSLFQATMAERSPSGEPVRP